MKAYFENVPAGAGSLVAFERLDPAFPFDWHYHPEFELTLIVDSVGQRLVGDTLSEYESGDLVLLGPNLPHTWRSVSPAGAPARLHRAIVIQFQEDFLGEKFFRLQEMVSVARLLKRSACGLGFAKTEAARRTAASLKAIPEASPPRKLLLLLDILLHLADEGAAEPLSGARVRPVAKPGDQQRVDAICQYLNRQFANGIDFAYIARLVHMDQASLCRFFKRATGRTMTAYVTESRVAAATHLLIETDLSVLEIGFRVGFGNYSNFNRQFKRMKGVSPRALREQVEQASGAFHS
jgi:AraC-like DNA-binding protein